MMPAVFVRVCSCLAMSVGLCIADLIGPDRVLSNKPHTRLALGTSVRPPLPHAPDQVEDGTADLRAATAYEHLLEAELLKTDAVSMSGVEPEVRQARKDLVRTIQMRLNVADAYLEEVKRRPPPPQPAGGGSDSGGGGGGAKAGQGGRSSDGGSDFASAESQ